MEGSFLGVSEGWEAVLGIGCCGGMKDLWQRSCGEGVMSPFVLSRLQLSSSLLSCLV